MARDNINNTRDGTKKQGGRPASKHGPKADSQGGGVEKFLQSLRSAFGSKKEETRISNFEISTDEMVERNSSVGTGRMHVLNLENLIVRRKKNHKEEPGRVMKLVAHAINEHFNKGDSFARVGNIFYLLFPKLTPQAGQVKCAAIADHIARLLAADQSSLFKMEIDKNTQTTERDRQHQEEKQRKIMFERSIVSKTLDEKTTPAQSAATVSAEATPKERQAEMPAPRDITVMYGTIWNVKNKLLTAYSCIPMTVESDGASYPFKLEQQTVIDRQTLLALDRYVQTQATACLRKLLSAGQKTLVVLPVHFKTVNNDAGLFIYRKGLADLSEEERRHIVLELVDPPPDLRGHEIAASVRNMRGSSRTVMAQVPVDSANLDLWSQAGVHAVGINLRGVPKNEKAFMTGMEELAARAEQSKLRTFVHGLETISMATIAVSAGIDYIEGNAVRAPVKSLEHVRPFETENLLAHLLPS